MDDISRLQSMKEKKEHMKTIHPFTCESCHNLTTKLFQIRRSNTWLGVCEHCNKEHEKHYPSS